MRRLLGVVMVAMLALGLGGRLWAAAPGVERAAGHGAVDAAAHDDGHRQHEVIGFDKATALWVVIIFVILLIVLYPTAWKQVLAGLKAREQRIRQDIADAEAARAQAEATLRQYNAQLAAAEAKVRQILADAAAQGERIAADLRLKAQQDAEQIQQRAAREIDAARRQALREIYEKAAELSTSIAARILRRSISVEDQRDLVRESLQQLQSLK